jgi:hypothetical protein
MGTTAHPSPWLRTLSAILGLALALAGTAMVVGIVASYAGGSVSVPLPTDHVLSATAAAELKAGAALDPAGDVTVVVADPTTGQATLAVLSWLPTALVAVTMLALLFRAVRGAMRSGPFTSAVVRRLRLLGVVVVVGGPVAWLTQFVAQFALVDTVSAAGAAAHLDLSTPLLWLLVGVGYLAVAEVARYGLAMRTELEEVI